MVPRCHGIVSGTTISSAIGRGVPRVVADEHLARDEVVHEEHGHGERGALAARERGKRGPSGRRERQRRSEHDEHLPVAVRAQCVVAHRVDVAARDRDAGPDVVGEGGERLPQRKPAEHRGERECDHPERKVAPRAREAQQAHADHRADGQAVVELDEEREAGEGAAGAREPPRRPRRALTRRTEGQRARREADVVEVGDAGGGDDQQAGKRDQRRGDQRQAPAQGRQQQRCERQLQDRRADEAGEEDPAAERAGLGDEAERAVGEDDLAPERERAADREVQAHDPGVVERRRGDQGAHRPRQPRQERDERDRQGVSREARQEIAGGPAHA